MKIIKYSDNRYGKSVILLNLDNVISISASENEIGYESVLGRVQGGYSPVIYAGSKSNVAIVYDLINDFLSSGESLLDLTTI